MALRVSKRGWETGPGDTLEVKAFGRLEPHEYTLTLGVKRVRRLDYFHLEVIAEVIHAEGDVPFQHQVGSEYRFEDSTKVITFLP